MPAKQSSTVPWHNVLLGAALSGLALGGLWHLQGHGVARDWTWAITTTIVLVPTVIALVGALLRKETNVDLIAVLAMGGALLLKEFLASTIIAVMLSGGTALERFAVSRARRELTTLLERAPRYAHRRKGDDVTTIDISEVMTGDRLLVKPGEVIPADGILASAEAVLDLSALTGESIPVDVREGSIVQSGGTNAGSPFEMRVTAPPDQGTYAGIIRLVRAAEQSKAPFVRLADRFALGFLGITLVMAAAAWVLSGDSTRVLAVLVVATPCPLILAAPAAIVAGISNAARRGIIVKGGGPLETLARTSVVLLDKTGTVTLGRPQVVAVEPFRSLSADDLVRLAASAEQASVHPFAPSIVAEAQQRGLSLTFPSQVEERMGAGVRARVGAQRVAVGQLGWVAPATKATASVRSVTLRTATEGSSAVFVAIDDELEGALILHDPLRPEAPRAIHDLRRAGIGRIYIVTGDRPDVADLVGDALGVDRVFAERTPEEKVDVVALVRPEGLVTMVGDGMNDAPALALADVGVAMGARGATAASEAADVVLTADRLEGVVTAVRIAQRTRRIALQSVFVGMGLSVAAMFGALAGLLTPVVGALVQEGIDVLVILNALRALTGKAGGMPKRGAELKALAHELAETHRALGPRVAELSNLAARLDRLEPAVARTELERTRKMLVEELLPHEQHEQETAYPHLQRLLGREDPTGPLIRTHQEIRRLARLFDRLLEQLEPDGPRPGDIRDLQRVLYGLHAILTLHFAQEDELYSLLD